MFDPCFVLYFVMPFLVLQKRAGCFALLSSGCHIAVRVLCLLLTVPWLGLCCVIVAFPRHTHFLL